MAAAAATDAQTKGTTHSFENSEVDNHERILMNNHEVSGVSLITCDRGSYSRTVGDSAGCGHRCQARNANPDKDSTITRISLSRILQSLREMESYHQESDSESESDYESSESEDSGIWESESEL